MGTTKVYARKGDFGAYIYFHFCPECGPTVYWEVEASPGKTGIPIGVFADPTFPPPSVSIFVPHRNPWVSVPEGIPQNEGHGAAFAAAAAAAVALRSQPTGYSAEAAHLIASRPPELAGRHSQVSNQWRPTACFRVSKSAPTTVPSLYPPEDPCIGIPGPAILSSKAASVSGMVMCGLWLASISWKSHPGSDLACSANRLNMSPGPARVQ